MPNPIIVRRLRSATISVTPQSFAGLAAWWKADSLSLADATAVGNGSTTDWLDSSGNGHTLTQVTSGSRPLFKTNIFGTKPGILFDGVDDFLSIASAPTFANDLTIMAAVRIATGGDRHLMGSSTLNRQVRGRGWANGNTMSFFPGANDSTSPTSLTLGVLPQRYAVSWRRINSSTTIFYRQNTTSLGSAVTGNGSFVVDQVGKNTSGSLFGDYIAELLMYTVSLTDAQVDSLYTNYLKPKWGLP